MKESSPVPFLNQIYRHLDERCTTLTCALRAAAFPTAYAYYNGHYSKNAEGTYVMDYFPIPVISVDGLCDLELELEAVSISTKLNREHALTFDYEKLACYRFEVFGVEDYLADYYIDGMTFEELRSNLNASAEKEIGFSLRFEADTDTAIIIGTVQFLQREGFYY